MNLKKRLISSIRNTSIKGTGRLSLFLAKLLTAKPKGETIIKTLYNFNLKVDPFTDKGVERSLYYFGTYEEGTLQLMENLLCKGDCFVDIGANIGLMSIYSALLIGKEGNVIAFEPNPVTRKILEDNIKLNNIQNIKVEGLAISNESKLSKIYDRWDINRGGASLIKPSFETQSYEIQEIPLSEYFTENQKIKLIKIDVEGYELLVLKGATKLLIEDNAPILILEFSSLRDNTFGRDTYPLYSFIKELNNYRIFKSIRGKERKSKLIEIIHESQLPKHDNIYCFTKQHLTEIHTDIFKTIPTHTK